MDIKVKSHRLELVEEGDSSGDVTIYKHYMTVILAKGDTDIMIARNEYTGELSYYYVEPDGYEEETRDDELYDVAEWMEEMVGPLDDPDGWEGLPTV